MSLCCLCPLGAASSKIQRNLILCILNAFRWMYYANGTPLTEKHYCFSLIWLLKRQRAIIVVLGTSPLIVDMTLLKQVSNIHSSGLRRSERYADQLMRHTDQLRTTAQLRRNVTQDFSMGAANPRPRYVYGI